MNLTLFLFGVLLIGIILSLFGLQSGKITTHWVNLEPKNMTDRIILIVFGFLCIVISVVIMLNLYICQPVKKRNQTEDREVRKTATVKVQPIEVKTYYQIVSRATGKFLEVDRGRTDDNAPILQNFRNEEHSQKFELLKIGTLYQIKNAKSESKKPQCLDVDECKKEDSVIIKQFPCREENNNELVDYNVRCQEFDLIKVKIPNLIRTPYQIRSLVSGKCLDVAGCGNNFNEVQILQCECREIGDTLLVSQLFDLIEVPK